MPTCANLDAMIRREDFDVADQFGPASNLGDNWRLSDLAPGKPLLSLLRKPDFQRETNSWEPIKIAQFIKSFVQDDLIPTLILWKSKSNDIFVIDGAHRLSALIAWTHDDYGDKAMSRAFFNNEIPNGQEKAAVETRNFIDSAIGSYARLDLAVQNPKTVTEAQLQYAKTIAIRSITLQWVNGDSKKAEKSFFVINQQAAVIETTELKLIKCRRKPVGLAARAIVRAGTGYRYWHPFEDSVQDEIENLAREIHRDLFAPELTTPIKTLDIPLAGANYTPDSVKFVFDFVSFANKVKMKSEYDSKMPLMRRKNRVSEVTDPVDYEYGYLADDDTGQETVEYLRTVRKIMSRITGNMPRSLGLHPAVYYYTVTGKFQPSAFLATVQFVEDMQRTEDLVEFTSVRKKFEELIVDYKYFINQIISKRGSGERGLKPIVELFHIALTECKKGVSSEEIINILSCNEILKDLIHVEEEDDKKYGKRFSSEGKSGAFLKEALNNAVRCGICGARIHMKSLSVDHDVRIADGGTASPDNATITHLFCNTGFKEHHHSRGTSIDLLRVPTRT